jgi:MraZ protein
MLNLVGEFECNLDSKGRFLFPAGLIRQMPSGEPLQFVINRGFEPCLVLYPASEWKKISDEINQLNMYVKKNREFIRYFYRGASEVLSDANKRLLLPKPLLEYASISKEIVLCAYSRWIEIWDKQKYYGLLKDEPEDFAARAEDVMSKKEARGDGLIP